MRLIDADELINIITYVSEEYVNRPDVIEIKGLMIGMLDESPTIDAVPVKHGWWIHDDEWWEFICTSCHKGIGNIKKYKYCPNCGAKMDLE